MNVLEAIRQNFDSAIERAEKSSPRDRVDQPLSKEQIEAYVSVRELLDQSFHNELQSIRDLDERVASSIYSDVRPTINELLHTDDALQVFAKVISSMLVEPDEPNLVFTSIFPTIRMEGNIGEVIRVTLTDAIEAQIVGEGQPLADRSLEFEGAAQNVKILKVGVQVGLTEEVIANSQWDLLGLHYRASANALARYKEEHGFKTLLAAANTVFDGVNGPAPHGKGSDGITDNNTLTVFDFVDMMSYLIANKMTPTDFFYNPAAWAGFLKDELMASVIGYGVGRPVPDGNMVKLPFAINAHMVPWLDTNLATRSATDPVTTDMLMVDRTKSAVLIQNQDPKPTEWFDPAVDIFRRKLIERYGVAVGYGGRGAVAARNITADANYASPQILRVVNTPTTP